MLNEGRSFVHHLLINGEQYESLAALCISADYRQQPHTDQSNATVVRMNQEDTLYPYVRT